MHVLLHRADGFILGLDRGNQKILLAQDSKNHYCSGSEKGGFAMKMVLMLVVGVISFLVAYFGVQYLMAPHH